MAAMTMPAGGLAGRGLALGAWGAAQATAAGLAIPGLVVGGKTGTAQLGTEPPRSHAWIIGFAGRPEERAEIAVAVLVEGQEGSSEQTGGAVAAPIARSILERFFV